MISSPVASMDRTINDNVHDRDGSHDSASSQGVYGHPETWTAA